MIKLHIQRSLLAMVILSFQNPLFAKEKKITMTATVGLANRARLYTDQSEIKMNITPMTINTMYKRKQLKAGVTAMISPVDYTIDSLQKKGIHTAFGITAGAQGNLGNQPFLQKLGKDVVRVYATYFPISSLIMGSESKFLQGEEEVERKTLSTFAGSSAVLLKGDFILNKKDLFFKGLNINYGAGISYLSQSFRSKKDLTVQKSTSLGTRNTKADNDIDYNMIVISVNLIFGLKY